MVQVSEHKSKQTILKKRKVSCLTTFKSQLFGYMAFTCKSQLFIYIKKAVMRAVKIKNQLTWAQHLTEKSLNFDFFVAKNTSAVKVVQLPNFPQKQFKSGLLPIKWPIVH